MVSGEGNMWYPENRAVPYCPCLRLWKIIAEGNLGKVSEAAIRGKGITACHRKYMHISSRFCILSSIFTDRVSDFFLKILCFNVVYSSTHTSHSISPNARQDSIWKCKKRGWKLDMTYLEIFVYDNEVFSFFHKKGKNSINLPKKTRKLGFLFHGMRIHISLKCPIFWIWYYFFYFLKQLLFHCYMIKNCRCKAMNFCWCMTYG